MTDLLLLLITAGWFGMLLKILGAWLLLSLWICALLIFFAARRHREAAEQ